MSRATGTAFVGAGLHESTTEAQEQKEETGRLLSDVLSSSDVASKEAWEGQGQSDGAGQCSSPAPGPPSRRAKLSLMASYLIAAWAWR